MNVIYAAQDAPETITKSIFLAGPSPRNDGQRNWRPEALEILEQLGFDGTVFIPLPEDGQWSHSYDDQVEWETRHLNMADVVAFWVPRDLRDLPAFTTNVEFGIWFDSCKAVLGYPPDAVKMKYLDHHARRVGTPVCDTLEATLQTAVDMTRDGVARTGGERFVPLHIWRTPQFQQWHRAQVSAGNRIDGAEVVWTFRPSSMSNAFYWALHVDVHIGAENRNKTIEVVLSRPNISTVVAYKRGDSTETTYIALVREFRSSASSRDGFILELPGGSSQANPQIDPAGLALSEFEEETGLALDAFNLRRIGERQCLGTMSAHHATSFAYELSDHELNLLRDLAKEPHGVSEDTERTYLEIHTLAEVLDGSAEVDWSNLGMILSAVR